MKSEDNNSKSKTKKILIVDDKKDDKEIFKFYSERLVKELKNKILALEKEISKRKQTEEQLKLLNRAIDQSPVTVIITDPKGNIEYVNPKFTELTGYTCEETIGQNPRIIKSDKHTLSFYKQLWGTIKQGKVWNGEFYNRKKNGERYWEDTSISPIKDSQGVITHFIAVKEDITKRKEAERERERLEDQVCQLQKLEAIGTLAGGIAHDFNNILTPILGFVEMSLLNLEPDSKIYKNLKRVSKAANRAKKLVNQILTFSRGAEKKHKPLMVHVIVKEVLKLLRASLPATIDIQANIDTECGVVLADATKIHQVIMNLCTNARDAMKDRSGVLEVSLNRIKVDAELTRKHPNLGDGTYAVLKVKDTGHGMSNKVTKRIFEPFFTTKGVGKGTGLGLSVVRGIILSSGGEITVKSEPGIGSTFIVYLPIIDVDVERQETEQEPIPRGSENVLYVDDEEEISSMGKLMLEELGYGVTTMTNSLKALEEFRNSPDKYDLVITDLIMPKMTGEKLSIELMRIRPDIPVILTTGFSDTFKPEDCKKLGIRVYVMKPFNIRDIAKAIRYALKKKKNC